MSPGALPYWMLGGTVVASFVIAAIVGFGETWFLPLVVIALVGLYGVNDVRLRRRERHRRDEAVT
jgi:hypothetical protein